MAGSVRSAPGGASAAAGGTFAFRLADLGEGAHEGRIETWFVQVGDRVQPFDPVCQVESAKASIELTTPVGGVVSAIRVPVGATAMVGDVLVELATDADAPRTLPASAGPPSGSQTPSLPTPSDFSDDDEWTGIVGLPPSARGLGPPASPPRFGSPGTAGVPPAPPPWRCVPTSSAIAPPASGPLRASPMARRLARDAGIRLEDVRGTGPEGRLRVADVEAAATAPVHVVSSADVEYLPVTALRRRLIERLERTARQAPLVTAFDTADVTELVAMRARSAAAPGGHRLTYLPWFVGAVVSGLRAVPLANATYDESTATIARHRRIHLGIATAGPDGLLVPVLRDADRRSLLEVQSEIVRLAEGARARRLLPADLVGSTFTLTNFGGVGGGAQFATPIVNGPEVAILGTGRIEAQARVRDGQVVARDCMGLSFTFDHRVLDGEDAMRFLGAVRAVLEDPARFGLTPP